jgi:hypothetical protein
MNKGIQRLVVVGLAMFALSAFAGLKEDQAACDKGDGAACLALGLDYFDGNGVPKSYERSANFLEKACAKNMADGCNILGSMYNDGTGVRQNKQLAAKFYDKACSNGRAQGCFNLGVHYYKGEGVQQDKQKAAKLFQKACDGGDENGCKNTKALGQTSTALAKPPQETTMTSETGGGSVPPPNRSTAAAPRNEGGIVEGSRVQCNWRNLGKLYPGTVAQKNGDAVFIHYDDGDQENTRTGMCRLMAGETASASNPSGLKVGSRVVCNWKAQGTFYPGTITRLNGAAAHIKYDDGDEEDTNINHCQGTGQNNNANTSSRAGMRRK